MKIREKFEIFKLRYSEKIIAIFKNTLKIVTHLAILGFIGFIIFNLQRRFQINNYNIVLSSLITTIGVFVAIIITFLFSKLFAEKSERINRKRKIDQLSSKLTALKKISHFILQSTKHWSNYPKIHLLDNIDLTLNRFKKLDLEKNRKIQEYSDSDSGAIQAYLSLKLIQGNEDSSLNYYDDLPRHNYSLKELEQFQDACQRIWYFYDRYADAIGEIKNESPLILEPIRSNIAYISPNLRSETINNKTIKNTFGKFNESIIRQIYYLTKRNNKTLEKNFIGLLMNLLGLSIFSIWSILILSVEYSSYCKILHTNIIVSGFIAITIDLIYNTIKSVKSELIIEEFYDPD